MAAQDPVARGAIRTNAGQQQPSRESTPALACSCSSRPSSTIITSSLLAVRARPRDWM